MVRMLALLLQEPAPGDEVHREADSVRVLEEHRVVAGRPRALLGRVHDPGADLPREDVHGVDVLAGARAEAHVVEPHAALVEAFARATLGRGAPAQGRAPPHAGVETL